MLTPPVGISGLQHAQHCTESLSWEGTSGNGPVQPLARAGSAAALHIHTCSAIALLHKVRVTTGYESKTRKE